VVLTDVVVTDKHGNPVTGLTRSDFRIMDNGKAQTLASFEEHREQTSPPEAPSACQQASATTISDIRRRRSTCSCLIPRRSGSSIR
jgi:VWFA-related protein